MPIAMVDNSVRESLQTGAGNPFPQLSGKGKVRQVDGTACLLEHGGDKRFVHHRPLTVRVEVAGGKFDSLPQHHS